MPAVCSVPVAVVGLGKLGLPLACVLAARGHPAVGIDSSAATVAALRQGIFIGHEPEVADLLAANGSRIAFTTDMGNLRGARTAFVVVPTPSQPDGHFSLNYVLPAVQAITRAVPRANQPFIIVLVSTVMPGDCERYLLPAIQSACGGSAGKVKLVYAPEFIALGDAVRGMRNPDLILLGSDDPDAAALVEEVLLSIAENQPRVVSTGFANAELAKLGLNALVAFKVGCANLLSQLCQNLPGADVDVVTGAIGADRRIGDRYFRGGLGFGGPCLPRDVRALSAVCHELGVASGIPDAMSRFNDNLPHQVVDLVLRAPPPDGRVGVLGLAYRPGTGIAEASHAVEIAKLLACAKRSVCVHDPVLRPADVPQLAGLRMRWFADVASLVEAVDIVVIASPDPQLFQGVECPWGGRTIVDCWRVLDPTHPAVARSTRARYIALGRGAQDLQDHSTLEVNSRLDELRAVLPCSPA